MRHVVLVVMLGLCGCRTGAPSADEAAVGATVDAFGAVEAWVGAERPGGVVERMHTDGETYVALVASNGAFELVRVARRDGIWQVIETLPGQEDYLWPEA